MNNPTLYQFVENGGEDGHTPFNSESVAGTTAETSMTRTDDEMVWSDEWGGMYTRRE